MFVVRFTTSGLYERRRFQWNWVGGDDAWAFGLKRLKPTNSGHLSSLLYFGWFKTSLKMNREFRNC